MICENPLSLKVGQVFPCGRCLACLIVRRRIWTHRIILESFLHPDNSFVTLTLSDFSLTYAVKTARPTLEPVYLQLFLKRLRRECSPRQLRFYAVGEYGDDTERPHFHLALFNFPTCYRGRTKRVLNTTRPDAEHCCAQCQLVHRAWGKGDVDLGTLEVDSAQYVAQYVTKKMTLKDDPRLDGRHPEFSRMSLRPGIGAGAMDAVADQLIAHDLVEPEGDVPSALRHGSRLLPLGRYLRKTLRVKVGMDAKAPQSTLDEAKARLSPVQAVVDQATAHPTMARFKRHLLAELTRQVFEEDYARLKNLEQIRKRRKSI